MNEVDLTFRPINHDDAREIINYRYDGDYSFYDMEKTATDLDTLLNSDDFDFFIVESSDEEMVGFIEVAFIDDIMEMGAALVPEFMGKGLGYDYISSCVDYLIEYYDYSERQISTLIKPFDTHAIKIYERVGFTKIDENDEYVELNIEI